MIVKFCLQHDSVARVSYRRLTLVGFCSDRSLAISAPMFSLFRPLSLSPCVTDTVLCLSAGVHDISRPGAAGRAADPDGRRVRTHRAHADARLSTTQRRPRHQTSVLSLSLPPKSSFPSLPDICPQISASTENNHRGHLSFSFQFQFISLIELERQGKTSCADRCP